MLWAAFFNFVAAFVVGTAVAKTIGKGLIDLDVVDPSVDPRRADRRDRLEPDHLVLRASRAPRPTRCIGGYAGAAVAKAGFGALILAGWSHADRSFIVLSPLLGHALGLALMVGLSWLFRSAPPGPRRSGLPTAPAGVGGLYSSRHGANDAQKTMGIIVGLLVVDQAHFAGQSGWLRHFYLPKADMSRSGSSWPPTWRSRWARVRRLADREHDGHANHQAAAVRRLLRRDRGGDHDPARDQLGVPVSTTHTITGAIVGVGAAQRLSAVRWGVAGRIVWAWILTIPMSAAIAAIAYLALHQLTLSP